MKDDFLIRIKNETNDLHKQIEAISYSSKILDFSLELEHYKNLLLANYIFLSQIEPGAGKFTELEEMILYSERKKLPLLEKDLQNLGINPVETKTKVNLKLPSFSIPSVLEAIASLYVVEGSTLGGAVIQRHLKQNPNMNSVMEYNFYGCYGKNVGVKWKEFCISLVRIANDEKKELAIINQARATFAYFISILEELGRSN
jgi:heme oxygenase (biliverdin-IX-beta and delta-forming)